MQRLVQPCSFCSRNHFHTRVLREVQKQQLQARETRGTTYPPCVTCHPLQNSLGDPRGTPACLSPLKSTFGLHHGCDPLIPPAFQKRSKEDARKHTRVLVVIGRKSQIGRWWVLVTAASPTFIPGAESHMKSISSKCGRIYHQYTKGRCCCSIYRKAPGTLLSLQTVKS